METLIIEFVTDLDNLVYLPVAWPVVAHHAKKFRHICETRKQSIRRAKRNGTRIPGNTARRFSNFLNGCHYAHRTGPWRRGGPNVWSW